VASAGARVDAEPRIRIVILPFLIYAGVDYLFRMTNALLAPRVAADLGLGPAGIGFVTGAFFVGFGLTQFPMGIALDRYGPRPVVIAQLSLAVAGALLCYFAATVIPFTAGRALMGIGLAGSFMAGLKASTLWLPPGRLPLLSGLVIAMTGIGGMLGTGPVAEILTVMPWRFTNLLLAALAALLLAQVALSVPGAPAAALGRDPIGRQIRDSLSIFFSPRFWRYAPVAMTGAGTSIAYQTLWTPLWLRDVAGFGDREVAWLMFGFLGCLAAGGFLLGWISQRVEQRGWPLMGLAVGGVGLTIGLEIPLALGVTRGAVGLWYGVALLYAFPIATYAVVTRAFPGALAARAGTALNLSLLVSAFAIQWAIGAVIGLFPAPPGGGYAVAAHRTALAGAVALQVAGVAWCLFAGSNRRVASSRRRTGR